jgi:hypothetical protein
MVACSQCTNHDSVCYYDRELCKVICFYLLRGSYSIFCVRTVLKSVGEKKAHRGRLRAGSHRAVKFDTLLWAVGPLTGPGPERDQAVVGSRVS